MIGGRFANRNSAALDNPQFSFIEYTTTEAVRRDADPFPGRADAHDTGN
jgi:hypothetical protein